MEIEIMTEIEIKTETEIRQGGMRCVSVWARGTAVKTVKRHLQSDKVKKRWGG